MLDSLLSTLHSSAVVITLTLLVLVNAGCVAMVAFQLPGTWLMLALTALAAWWRWEEATLSAGVLVAMLLLAILGEVFETFTSSAAAGKAGGSKRGMIGAVIGGVAGAIVGSVVIPILVVGTLIGACVGAGAGSMAGDRWAGRNWREAYGAGRAAARGRLWGTIGKLAVAAAMWLIATGAILWP